MADGWRADIIVETTVAWRASTPWRWRRYNRTAAYIGNGDGGGTALGWRAWRRHGVPVERRNIGNRSGVACAGSGGENLRRRKSNIWAAHIRYRHQAINDTTIG